MTGGPSLVRATASSRKRRQLGPIPKKRWNGKGGIPTWLGLALLTLVVLRSGPSEIGRPPYLFKPDGSCRERPADGLRNSPLGVMQ